MIEEITSLFIRHPPETGGQMAGQRLNTLRPHPTVSRDYCDTLL